MQISELIEDACKNSRDYLQVTDDTTDKKQFKRQNRRDNKPSSANKVVINKEGYKALKFAVSFDTLSVWLDQDVFDL